MTTIQNKRGTLAQWEEVDPVLAVGEPAFEIDTGRYKIGNGELPYTNLPYFLTIDLLEQLFEPLGQTGESLSVEDVQDAVSTLFTTGNHSGLSFVYDNAGNRINVTLSQETVQDLVASLFTSGDNTGINYVYDDVNGKINTEVTVTGGGGDSGGSGDSGLFQGEWYPPNTIDYFNFEETTFNDHGDQFYTSSEGNGSVQFGVPIVDYPYSGIVLSHEGVVAGSAKFEFDGSKTPSTKLGTIEIGLNIVGSAQNKYVQVLKNGQLLELIFTQADDPNVPIKPFFKTYDATNTDVFTFELKTNPNNIGAGKVSVEISYFYLGEARKEYGPGVYVFSEGKLYYNSPFSNVSLNSYPPGLNSGWSKANLGGTYQTYLMHPDETEQDLRDSNVDTGTLIFKRNEDYGSYPYQIRSADFLGFWG